MPALRSQRDESRDPCRAFNNPSQAASIYHIPGSIQGRGRNTEGGVQNCSLVRVTSKYFPVNGAKIPVGDAREFSPETPVKTGLHQPPRDEKGLN